MLYFFSRLNCRVSTSVVHRLPKPRRRVRLPYPAPHRSKLCIACSDFFISQSSSHRCAAVSLRGNINFNRPFQKRRTSVRCPSFCVSAARSVHRSFAQTKQPPPSLAVTFFLRKEQAGCLLPTPGRPHRKEEDTMKKTLSLARSRIPVSCYKSMQKSLREY